MKDQSRRSTAAWLMGCVVLVGCAAWSPARSLESDIRAVLADKALANGVVGVSVARLGDSSAGGEVNYVFRSNGDRPLIPASNHKVLTTSAALATLGADFKFRTQLVYKDGDLFLLGDGDPTLGDPDLLKRIGWSYDTVFKQWADELKRQGVTSVRNVYIDDSIFDSERVHPKWPKDQLQYAYSAEVAGLAFSFNTVNVLVSSSRSGIGLVSDPPTSYVKLLSEVRTGDKNAVSGVRSGEGNQIVVRGEVKSGAQDQFDITVSDPGLYAGTVLFETLRREGISMTGGVGRDNNARRSMAASPASFRTMGILETPISVVLGRCNKDSANLYAESLAKRLGAKASGQPGSWENYRTAASAWMRRIGVPEGQFAFDDGCGLSRGNRISADGMVRVLAYDFATPYRDLFIKSMAVGGVDGTLSNRFNNDLKGRVHAKSGFISGVSTLSGYVQAKSGRWYAFSILMNNVSGVRALHERIVRAIDENDR